jgi:hypothetical protein
MSDFERPPKTTMIDIYEAAGYEVSEDRQSVVMDSSKPLRSFDIILRVFPSGLEYYGNSGQAKMTFAVDLRTEHDYSGFGQISVFEHEAEISIPIDQVRIYRGENNE